ITRPYCQYRPVSAKNGAMYIMFLDMLCAIAAPGWSGSGTCWFIMPRLALCRMVRNVVQALIATEARMTARTVQDSPVVAHKNLSESSTPNTWAVCALLTVATDSPYLGACPGTQSEMALSTLNRDQKTGSWATRGRHPPSGLMPFSL